MPAAPLPAPSLLAPVVRGFAETALAAVDDPTRYLELRRAIAAGRAMWRLSVSPAVEVLVGPPRPSADEQAGALGILDTALADSRDDEVARQRFQIKNALNLIDQQLGRDPPNEARVAFVLSAQAYEVGEAILESSPLTPATEEAVVADIEGLLSGIVQASEALSAGRPEAQAALHDVAASCRAIGSALPTLSGRAALVVESGRLGVAVRKLARALGYAAHAPYTPRVPLPGIAAEDQPISALTIPTPRGVLPSAVELGRALFFDRRLSANGRRSCADCHDPKRAFTDGRATPGSLTSDAIKRNVPTLLYSALDSTQFWDGRVLTQRDQAAAVIHNAAEMGLDDKQLLAVLAADTPRFKAVFADGLTTANIGRALAAYEAWELTPATGRIDRFVRGELKLSDDESGGLDVFVGAGRCARCHVPPTFAGSRPTDFAVAIYAVIGVPKAPSSKLLDDDLGRARVSKVAADEHAFKVPTVRNVKLTAPYFHHGMFPTLDGVIDFYDRGGGRGLGIAVPNQDPDVRPLHLTAIQKRQLRAFLTSTLSESP